MPLRKSRPFLLACLAFAATPSIASAHGLSVLPAVSASNPVAACTEQATTKAFLKFGDLADYSLAPGGNFEGSLAGWTLKNAQVVGGNENAGISPGFKSLLLGASTSGGDAVATSPEFCVTEDHPTFRFVTKNNGSGKSRLKTELVYRTLDNLNDVDDETADIVYQDMPFWSPSAINPLATELSPAKLRRGVLMRLSFQINASVAKKGGVLIDNVLIDPYRRG